jgi:hypothetical protein
MPTILARRAPFLIFFCSIWYFKLFILIFHTGHPNRDLFFQSEPISFLVRPGHIGNKSDRVGPSMIRYIAG